MSVLRDIRPIWPTSPPRLALSTEETAEALGVSPRTVEGLRDAGKIPTVNIGRRRVHPVADLTAWLTAKASQAAEASAQAAPVDPIAARLKGGAA